MPIKLTIDNGPDNGGVTDYTSYVLPESISVQDSLNVPTLLTFTLANNNDAFIPPVRSAYCRLFSGKFGVPIATGFVTAAPSLTYLGLGNNIPKFNFQRYTYDIQVSSDEWLLNVKTVPFMPPFVNLGQGQILARLAQILVPNFFDTTSFVASGDLVPYWPYDPTVNWSDLAKQFADGSRFHYKCIDKKLYFQPYGDQPLGVSYDETKGERTFYPTLLQTPVQSVPPCNDAIVIGDIEAQNNHDDYFVGDGITGNFPLRHEMFEGASSIVVNEPWSSDTVNNSLWTVLDPTFMVSEQGGGLQLDAKDTTDNVGTPLGETYVLANQGIELGGAVNIQLGDFQFTDVNNGLVGGLYRTLAADDTLPGGANCVAAFQLGSHGTVVPTASGAIGVTMQPFLFGNALGPTVISQQNHSYFLQMYFSCQTYSRYDRAYRTLTGNVFGDVNYAGVGTITWLVADTSVDFPNNPNVTLFSISGVNLPEFAVYAEVNGGVFNFAVANTLLGFPPQGGLYVRSLYGPTANQFPVFPPGPELQYLLGFGFQNQVATIASTNDIQQLQFYASSYQTLAGATLPAVGSRIRLQTWEAGYAMARVQDPIYIAAESKIVGDDGHRTAVFSSLNPIPRTSSECDAAGAAIIMDREGVQYEGTYTFDDYFLDSNVATNSILLQDSSSGIWLIGVTDAGLLTCTPSSGTPVTVFLNDTNGNSWQLGITTGGILTTTPVPNSSYPASITLTSLYGIPYRLLVTPSGMGGALPTSGYPTPGRYLIVTSPQRGISGLKLLVRRVTITGVELRQEKLQLVVDYGPDYYLDKTLANFVEFRQNVLTPKDTAIAPTPQQLLEVGEFYLPTLDNCRIIGMINGYTCVVDLGQLPVSACEVRKADFGWTQDNALLLFRTTSRYFCLPRKANEEVYYLRQVNGGLYSRFSKVLRLVYPLVPHPPPYVLIDFSVPLAPVIQVILPLNTDRNIYGVQIDDGGTLLTPPGPVSLVSDSPTDTRIATVVGYDGVGNLIQDSVTLNGVTPVATSLSFTLVESVQIQLCCAGSS